MCGLSLSVAVLRSLRSPVAEPATVAVSVILLLWLPLGTAAFIYWLVSVRKREPVDAMEPGEQAVGDSPCLRHGSSTAPLAGITKHKQEGQRK
jgi:hypothetical protein